MKQLRKIVESIVENRPEPTNWKAGFKDPDDKDSYQDTPLRLMRGEVPFQVHGQWYLYVYDEREGDLVVYDFQSDMVMPYEDFQKRMGTIAECRRISLEGFLSIL